MERKLLVILGELDTNLNKNEKELIFSTLTLFVFSIIGIFAFLLIYLRATSFTPENLIFAMGLSFVLAGIFGFILAKHAIAFSVATHSMLRRLTKNILHELNIPVSTIKGNVHLIRRKCEDETTLKRLARIEKASDSLIELYEELEFTIKREIREIDKKEISLDLFIADRIELFLETDENCSIDIHLDKSRVVVNEQGLKHCFDNLITNAIKYGKSGGKISVVLKNNILSVSDDGEGIDGTEIANIFNRYYQVDRDSKGKGIGLSLVKEFCDEHKVKISIDSKKGLGTTFNLDFNGVNQP